MNSTRDNFKKTKATILLDKSNNWLETFISKSELFLRHPEFEFRISHNRSEPMDQDIVFILGYTEILNEDFLKRNALNLVVHESDLPNGKGFAPVQWQILEGAKRIPLCLLEAADKVDTGDIICRHEFEVSGHELYNEIREKQAKATIELLAKFLAVYPNFAREKQVGEGSFYPKRGINDGELNIDETIRNQFSLLRIGNNDSWPSFFIYDGRKYILKIYSSEVQED